MKRKTLSLMAFVLLATLSGTTFAGTYSYQTTSNNFFDRSEISIQNSGNNYIITSSNNAGKSTVNCADDFNSVSFNFVTSREVKTISFKTNNGIVIVTAQKDGKLADTRFDPQNQPVYAMPFQFKNFVFSGKSEQNINLFVGFGSYFMQLKLIRESTEKIKTKAGEFDAVKVRMTLPDWRAFMWSSSYWFRKSDGVLIKTEELRGPPGSQIYKMELVEARP